MPLIEIHIIICAKKICRRICSCLPLILYRSTYWMHESFDTSRVECCFMIEDVFRISQHYLWTWRRTLISTNLWATHPVHWVCEHCCQLSMSLPLIFMNHPPRGNVLYIILNNHSWEPGVCKGGHTLNVNVSLSIKGWWLAFKGRLIVK